MRRCIYGQGVVTYVLSCATAILLLDKLLVSLQTFKHLIVGSVIDELACAVLRGNSQTLFVISSFSTELWDSEIIMDRMRERPTIWLVYPPGLDLR